LLQSSIVPFLVFAVAQKNLLVHSALVISLHFPVFNSCSSSHNVAVALFGGEGEPGSVHIVDESLASLSLISLRLGSVWDSQWSAQAKRITLAASRGCVSFDIEREQRVFCSAKGEDCFSLSHHSEEGFYNHGKRKVYG
jgi:hypothetical protein